MSAKQHNCHACGHRFTAGAGVIRNRAYCRRCYRVLIEIGDDGLTAQQMANPKTDELERRVNDRIARLKPLLLKHRTRRFGDD